MDTPSYDASPDQQDSGGYAQKGCSWCSNPAIDRVIQGTKARYCITCWNWWFSDGGGAAQPIPESFVPLPPPDATHLGDASRSGAPNSMALPTPTFTWMQE